MARPQAWQVKVAGLDEIRKNLEDLPVRIQRNVMRGAVRAGAKVLQKTAARKARVSTRAGPYSRGKGRLADNVVISTKRARGDEMIAGIAIQHRSYVYQHRLRSGKVVTRNYDPARIWHFIEFGTNPRKPKKFKKKQRNLGFVAERPFIRTTIREEADSVLRAMQAYASKRIEKAALKTAAAILLVQGE